MTETETAPEPEPHTEGIQPLTDEPEPSQPIAYPPMDGVPHEEAVALDNWMPALLTYSLSEEERAALTSLQTRITDYLAANP